MKEYKQEDLEAYIRKINEVKPELFRERKLGKDKYGNDKIYKFIPIDTLERLIDEIYFGLWKDIDFQITAYMNEIIGTYKAEYYHPVIKEWMPVIGVGAIPVQQVENTAITDFESAKIKNALEYCAPNLYERCKGNALQSLGKLFGRGYNRREDQKATAEIFYGESYDEQIEKKIKNTKDFKDFTKEELKYITFSKQLVTLAKAKKEELKNENLQRITAKK